MVESSAESPESPESPVSSDSADVPTGERERSLQWAESARSHRFALRDKLRSGELTVGDVLATAKTDPLTAQAKLLWILESPAGVEKVVTRRKLAELGIDESLRIGSLTEAQLDAIRSEFGAAHSED